METFIIKFKNLIESEGYTTITAFVNKWIKDGGTFRTLYEWVILKGIDTKYITVWVTLRPYLTIPYSSQDQFWYYWNAVAKSKGYFSAERMLNNLTENLTLRETANELDTSPRNVLLLIKRIKYYDRKEMPQLRARRNNKWHTNKDGFSRIDAKTRWEEALKEKGFRGLRDALRRLRDKGLTFKEIAKELKTTDRNLRFRMAKAKINTNDYPQRRMFRKMI